MATQPEHIVVTYDDYRQIPSDRNRYELFEGELAVTPAPSLDHQSVVTNLTRLLANHVRRHRLGKVLVAPCDVFFSDFSVVQPDLVFIAAARSSLLDDPRYVKGAPDLVVEVLSPSTARHDLHIKRQLYARYGVPHYWIFDPDRREARALVLDGADYRLVATATGDQPFAVPPFPDLAIPLAEVWE